MSYRHGYTTRLYISCHNIINIRLLIICRHRCLYFKVFLVVTWYSGLKRERCIVIIRAWIERLWIILFSITCSYISGKLKKFCNSISVGAFLDESDDISLEEIKNRQNAALTSISSVCSKDGLQGAVGGIEFHILPVSHSADLIEAAAEQDLLLSEKSLISSSKNGLCEHGPGDRTPNGDKMPPRICGASNSCMLSPISNLMAEFERMSLHDDLDRTNRERRRSGGKRHKDAQPTELTSGLGRLSLSSEDDSVFEKGRTSLLRAVEKDGAETRNEEDARSSASSGEYFMANEGLDFLNQRSVESPGGERTICARSKSWDHGGRDLSSSGSSSSYRSLDSSQDFILRTPPRMTKRLYIEGWGAYVEILRIFDINIWYFE